MFMLVVVVPAQYRPLFQFAHTVALVTRPPPHAETSDLAAGVPAGNLSRPRTA